MGRRKPIFFDIMQYFPSFLRINCQTKLFKSFSSRSKLLKKLFFFHSAFNIFNIFEFCIEPKTLQFFFYCSIQKIFKIFICRRISCSRRWRRISCFRFLFLLTDQKSFKRILFTCGSRRSISSSRRSISSSSRRWSIASSLSRSSSPSTSTITINYITLEKSSKWEHSIYMFHKKNIKGYNIFYGVLSPSIFIMVLSTLILYFIS